MTTCNKCNIPIKYPGIDFKNGTCSFCLNHTNSIKNRRKVLGNQKLKELLSSRNDSNYDCTIGMSGGKDSSYMLYYIVKELNMKPLVLFFDNGFIAKEAKQNVQEICDKLGVDLEIGYASKYRLKLIKEILLILKKTGIDQNVCTNCENNLRTFVINRSIMKKIPFILWGSTDYEDAASSFVSTHTKTFRDSFNKKPNPIKRVSRRILFYLDYGLSIRELIILFFGLFKISFLKVLDNIKQRAPLGLRILNPLSNVSFSDRNVKIVYFYDYIDYDPIRMINILKKELNWKSKKEVEMRMDCNLHIITNYLAYRKNGISNDGFTFSVLVRNGLLTRDDAIQKEDSLAKNLFALSDKLTYGMGINNCFQKIEK